VGTLKIIFVGILDPVSNLTTIAPKCDSIVNITWTAPYSIDVPSTDPDITYCVNAIDTFASSPVLMYSRCGIDQISHHILSQKLFACAEYQVGVTAVNKVGNSSPTFTNLQYTGIVFAIMICLCLKLQTYI